MATTQDGCFGVVGVTVTAAAISIIMSYSRTSSQTGSAMAVAVVAAALVVVVMSAPWNMRRSGRVRRRGSDGGRLLPGCILF